MKDYSEELGTFLEEYINTHSISFVREDPHVLVSRLSALFSPFFPHSEEDKLLEGLKEKALYSLWNIVIDDAIEYRRQGRDSVLDSMETLAEIRKRESFKGRTEAGQTLYDFCKRFHELPPEPNKTISEELVFLDLARIINGFDYERIIHENGLTSTMSEYLEFGAVTADPRIFLDIDVAICPHELSFSTIGNLREAYRWFNLAIKLSSDIATFEREYYTEASQNAVIIHGQEKGVLPGDVLRAERTYKEQLYQDVIPSLLKEIENEGRKYLSRSLKCLKKIKEIDTSIISTVFESTFEHYPGPRDFPPPSAE